MITEDGHFYHIDFGYLFGKEPPLKGSIASKIRITTSMIEVMGGVDSVHYKKFETKTVEAFMALRNHRDYIMNLMNLLVHSGLTDLPFDNHQ